MRKEKKNPTKRLQNYKNVNSCNLAAPWRLFVSSRGVFQAMEFRDQQLLQELRVACAWPRWPGKGQLAIRWVDGARLQFTARLPHLSGEIKAYCLLIKGVTATSEGWSIKGSLDQASGKGSHLLCSWGIWQEEGKRFPWSSQRWLLILLFLAESACPTAVLGRSRRQHLLRVKKLTPQHFLQMLKIIYRNTNILFVPNMVVCWCS